MSDNTTRLDPKLQSRLDNIDARINANRDQIKLIGKAVSIMSVRLETAERTAMGLLHLMRIKGIFNRNEYKALKAFVAGDAEPLRALESGNGQAPKLWVPEGDV